MGVKDGYAYFGGGLDLVYDIYRVKSGTSTLEKMGSIELEDPSIVHGVYLWRSVIKENEIILSYLVNVLNDIGKRTSIEYYINMDLDQLGIPTATKDIVKTIEVGLSPNPVLQGGRISISLSKKVSGQVKIMTIEGIQVLTQAINSSSEIEITDTENLKSGIYVVEIETNKNLITKKIIVVGY